MEAPVKKGERRIIVCVEHGNSERVTTSARHNGSQQQVLSTRPHTVATYCMLGCLMSDAYSNTVLVMISSLQWLTAVVALKHIRRVSTMSMSVGLGVGLKAKSLGRYVSLSCVHVSHCDET